jgi:hypothetical protein
MIRKKVMIISLVLFLSVFLLSCVERHKDHLEEQLATFNNGNYLTLHLAQDQLEALELIDDPMQFLNFLQDINVYSEVIDYSESKYFGSYDKVSLSNNNIHSKEGFILYCKSYVSFFSKLLEIPDIRYLDSLWYGELNKMYSFLRILYKNDEKDTVEEYVHNLPNPKELILVRLLQLKKIDAKIDYKRLNYIYTIINEDNYQELLKDQDSVFLIEDEILIKNIDRYFKLKNYDF